MSGWVLELLLRWGPPGKEVWDVDGVVEEEVFCLRCAELEYMREVAVLGLSSEEVAPKILIWKSLCWLLAVPPTPGHLLACSQGKPP